MSFTTATTPSKKLASTPTLMCVGGMLQVVSMPPMEAPPPKTPSSSLPPASLFTSQLAIQDSQPDADKPQLLTQKQVRELRRLCRKTANRADFEDRLIQLRQIASIAAMGTPATRLFDPHNPNSGASLRGWVERHREEGADWRDERPLPDDAVEELRRWDRGLKAWARLRFESAPALHPHAEVPKPTQGPPGFAPLSASPVTPHLQKQRMRGGQPAHFGSPISPEEALRASPVQSLYSSAPVQPGDVVKLMENRNGGGAIGEEMPHSAMEAGESYDPMFSSRMSGVRPTRSEVSINRVGNTINITVPTGPMADLQICDSKEELAQVLSRTEQDKAHPSAVKRSSYLHAANTSRSWRNATSGEPHTNYTLSAEKELAFRTAAKNLFSSSSTEVACTGGVGSQSTALKRSDMDWGKLRRPALRTLDVNSNTGHHIPQRFPSHQ